MKCCRLCARDCGTARNTGAGRCGQTEDVWAGRAALHMWEEPCISGKRGSGAVFFTGCPLHCVFCQNRDIAKGGSIGRKLTIPQLAESFLMLQGQGAHNINLVTPTQYVPQIVEAVSLAREGIAEEAGKARLQIPVLYNTGSIEKPETVRMLKDTVDIFLPDLKYRDGEIAKRYSHMENYFSAAKAAIAEMVRISGDPVFDDEGMMVRGTMVRHMVLPGHTKDSMEILRYLRETYGDSVYISIMGQYTPMPGIEKRYPELGRRVTRREYEKVVDFALSIGIERAYIQERGTAKESFIPAFDGTGLP